MGTASEKKIRKRKRKSEGNESTATNCFLIKKAKEKQKEVR